jgi:2-polyprenyl-6-methoxyphenol hydroxylase-like FAD-dependent oxidoreductase
MVAGQPRRAKLVVAADGAQSRIRAQLGWTVPSRRRRIGMRAHFKLPAGRASQAWVDIFVAPGHEIYVTPLPNNELLVAALSDGGALEAAPSRVFLRWCHSHRGLAARLEGGEQITDLLTTSPLSCRSRHGAAPGVVLLGDAAGSCDPVTGGGIAQALVTAELLAGYIVRHGLGNQSWLSPFDRNRRAVLRDYVRLTGSLLWLTGHPRLARHAVRLASRRPRIVSHLVGVAGGTRSLLPLQFSPASSMRV